MKKLLVTGFDPFNGNTANPSWLAAQALPQRVGDYEVHKLQLPTVYGQAAQMVMDFAATLQPDVILCLGLAGGRAAVTPERVGINIRSASIPDNAGQQFTDAPIIPGGPTAYFSSLPVTAMASAIREAGVPGAVSNTAARMCATMCCIPFAIISPEQKRRWALSMCPTFPARENRICRWLIRLRPFAPPLNAYE